MPAYVRSGYRRHSSAQTFAAEFRAQAFQMQAERLSGDLTQLRAAIRDHLMRPEPHTLARLRFLLGQSSEKAAA